MFSSSFACSARASIISLSIFFVFVCVPIAANTKELIDEPTIVISASRSEQVVTDALPHTTVIGRKAIENSTASDVVSLLKMQSGLTVTQAGSQGSLTGVRIRGAEPRHTLVLIDGVPMNTLSSGFSSLEHIPLSSIERIEIVRGNVSALYGSQAVGGLIQIFTRKSKGNDATIRFAMGSLGQRQGGLQVRGGNDKVQATFGIAHEEVNAVSAQNPNQTAQPASLWSSATRANADKDAYRNDSANGQIYYRPNDKHEFGLHFLEARGKNYYDNEFSTSINSIQYTKNHIQNFSVYSKNQFAKNWKSKLGLSQYMDRSDSFDSHPSFGTGMSRFQTRTKEFTWQNNIFTNTGELVVGLSRVQQSLSSSTEYDNKKRSINSVWLGYNLDKTRHHLQLNARTDKFSDIGRENTALINYGIDIADKTRLFVGYSNGFAAPNFNELFYPSFSNPKLKAEHANYLQAGVQYNAGNLGGRLTFFDTRYRNKIALDTLTYLPINIEQSRANGIEWHGWYNIHGWSFDSSLTYQEVKNRKTAERLPRHPRILATLSVGRNWGKWSAQINWQAQGNSLDTGKKKVAGYGVVNAVVNYSPLSNLKFGLSVGNIFNRHYQTIYGYNSMPRNVLLSLQYRPQW